MRSARQEQPPPPEPVAVRGASGTGHGGRAVRQAAAGLAAAAVVSLTGFAGDVSPLPTPPARAESLTVAFPVAKAREVGRAPSSFRLQCQWTAAESVFKKEGFFMVILFVWAVGR